MEILIIGVYLPNLIHLIIPIDQSMAMIDLTSSFLGHPSMATTTVRWCMHVWLGEQEPICDLTSSSSTYMRLTCQFVRSAACMAIDVAR